MRTPPDCCRKHLFLPRFFLFFLEGLFLFIVLFVILILILVLILILILFLFRFLFLVIFLFVFSSGGPEPSSPSPTGVWITVHAPSRDHCRHHEPWRRCPRLRANLFSQDLHLSPSFDNACYRRLRRQLLLSQISIAAAEDVPLLSIFVTHTFIFERSRTRAAKVSCYGCARIRFWICSGEACCRLPSAFFPVHLSFPEHGRNPRGGNSSETGRAFSWFWIASDGPQMIPGSSCARPLSWDRLAEPTLSPPSHIVLPAETSWRRKSFQFS